MTFTPGIALLLDLDGYSDYFKNRQYIYLGYTVVLPIFLPFQETFSIMNSSSNLVPVLPCVCAFIFLGHELSQFPLLLFSFFVRLPNWQLFIRLFSQGEELMSLMVSKSFPNLPWRRSTLSLDPISTRLPSSMTLCSYHH